MRALFIVIALLVFTCSPVMAQTIQVSPSSVNAYSQGATSVLLTFGGLNNQQPGEATWCGALMPAFPGLGFQCDPATIFGRLPQRYNQSRLSANNSYTDIMSITPQVARRAYTDAVRGNTSTFFYVRRFISTVGGPDEFVPVTIRLSGNGAGVPLSLTEVKLTWGVGKPVLFIKSGEALPRFVAEITYTGTGRLKGRWELVKPGEDPPEPRDLLTEATLPSEERAGQRRYTQMSRFNVFLPPSGKIVLPGPESWRVDESLNGLYIVLLRIEASDDGEANTDLASVGAGAGVLSSGAVAGFSLPVLKYYVSNSGAAPAAIAASTLLLLRPDDQATLTASKVVDFTWSVMEGAATYRFEVEDLQNSPVISAILPVGVGTYRTPPWFKDRVGRTVVRWRVIAFDQENRAIATTDWRGLRLADQ
ncbi:MAG TPA: hypothetical protein VIB00_02050 [Pyrinomonadaceae bacterium]|jgi:hypothetical protein